MPWETLQYKISRDLLRSYNLYGSISCTCFLHWHWYVKKCKLGCNWSSWIIFPFMIPTSIPYSSSQWLYSANIQFPLSYSIYKLYKCQLHRTKIVCIQGIWTQLLSQLFYYSFRFHLWQDIYQKNTFFNTNFHVIFFTYNV